MEKYSLLLSLLLNKTINKADVGPNILVFTRTLAIKFCHKIENCVFKTILFWHILTVYLESCNKFNSVFSSQAKGLETGS